MPREYVRKPVIDRVMAKVIEVGEHWMWTGTAGSSGYGQITEGGRTGRMLGVHRVVWEHHNGPIPDGLVLDHTDECLTILCCNPAHLEPVTQAENRRRQATRRTACDRGHEYTPENTRVGRNGRECRTCHAKRARQARRRARERRQAQYVGICPRGHARTPENTWQRPTGPTCRDCMSESARHRAPRESGSGTPAS